MDRQPCTYREDESLVHAPVSHYARLCNEDGDLWHAFNLFYCAVVFDYYHVWKTQRKTIKDSGYVLKGE